MVQNRTIDQPAADASAPSESDQVWVCRAGYSEHVDIALLVKETPKQVVALEWDKWGNRLTSYQRRWDKGGILARYGSFEEAQGARDRAVAAWKEKTPEVTVAKAALEAATKDRRDAWRAAVVGDAKSSTASPSEAAV